MLKLSATLLTIVLFITANTTNAQNIEGEFGGLGAVDVKSESYMFGGSVSIKSKFKSGESIGVGTSGFYHPKSEQLWLPVYLDLRIPIVPNLELTLHPGYTIYDKTFVGGGVAVENKGSFYAGGGLTAYMPPSRGSRVFFQAKYNYFSFKTTSTIWLSQGREQVTKMDTHAHVVSFGLGVAFGER